MVKNIRKSREISLGEMRRDKEETRERIIEAAMDIFADNGFFKAPVGLIAMRAGLSKGLIFWHFRTKDELVREVALRSLPKKVIEGCINLDLLGKDLLSCIAHRYIEFYSNSTMRKLLLHTLSISDQYPIIKEELSKICSETLRKIAKRTCKNVLLIISTECECSLTLDELSSGDVSPKTLISINCGDYSERVLNAFFSQTQRFPVVH